MHETRQRIIEFLKEKRQATVDELAAAVGLTPMAVRYHLNVLHGDNLIMAFAVRRQNGPGRPQQVYKLTEAADELFPQDYYTLTDYLLSELSRRLEPEEITDLFKSIGSRLANEAPASAENQTFEERLDDLIQFLSEKGFAVYWEAEDNEDNYYLIHTHFCPYRQVAKEHDKICSLDKQIIGTMLNTTPTRIACLIKGDDHCSYRVSRPVELHHHPA